jgi:hypothetical protein
MLISSGFRRVLEQRAKFLDLSPLCKAPTDTGQSASYQFSQDSYDGQCVLCGALE